jgi:hypothetical protein
MEAQRCQICGTPIFSQVAPYRCLEHRDTPMCPCGCGRTWEGDAEDATLCEYGCPYGSLEHEARLIQLEQGGSW